MRFTLEAALCAALLVVSSASVARDASPKGLASVQLQGSAFFTSPLANATLEVTGATIQSGVPSTDASGNYAITLSASDPTRVVTITARGVGGDADIVYRTTPGSLNALLAAAGGDAIVTSAEEPYIDLTPLTTGFHLAMAAAIAPQPLATEAEFARAARTFSARDARNRGWIIAALAADAIAFPAGYATTLDVASSLAASIDTSDRMDPLIPADCSSGAVCAAVVALTDSPVVSILPVTPDVEYRTFIEFAPESSDLTSGYRFDTGGGGSVRGSGAPQAITWSIDGTTGFLRALPVSGSFGTGQSFDFRDCGQGLAQYRSIITESALLFRFARGPGGSTLLMRGSESTRTFPDNPECASHAGTFVTEPRFFKRVVPASAVPLSFDDPTGQSWVLTTCFGRCAGTSQVEGQLDNFVSEIHDFGVGTGATRRTGQTFTWSLVGGALQIAYSNGASVRFVLVADDTDAYDSVVLEYTDTDATVHVTDGTRMRVDPAAAFTTVEADYYSQINRGFPFATLEASLRIPFGFRFQPDGTGGRLDGVVRHVTWTRSPDQRRVTFDQFSSPDSAINLNRRIWEIIRVDGDLVYVLENSYFAAPGTTTALPSSRLFAYRRNALPGAGNVPTPNGTLANAAGNDGDQAGEAVASGGGVVVIGAPNGDASGVAAGEVYVFAQPAAAPLSNPRSLAWSMKNLTLLATLTPSAGSIGDKWGASVAVSPDGSRIFIGSPGAGDGAGEVAIFEKPDSGDWTSDASPDAALPPPAGAGSFGASLALADDGTLAVGAPLSDDGVNADSGMAAVYQPSGNSYPLAPSATMTNPSPEAGANFGAAVAATATRIVVGAPNQDAVDGADVGAVHTWQATAPGATFTQGPSLPAPVGAPGDKWGSAVGVQGSTVVATAPGADSDRGIDAGGAWLYEDPGTGLPTAPSATLRPLASEGDGAGQTLAIIDGVIALGAPLATRDGKPASGTAFMFRRPDGGWAAIAELLSQQEILPTSSEANQRFGASLALARDELVVGVPLRANARGEAEAYSLERIFGGPGASFE